MGAFLRRIVETHTEMTEFLLSVATRGANPRYPQRGDRSDGEVVMSDLAHDGFRPRHRDRSHHQEAVGYAGFLSAWAVGRSRSKEE